MGYKAVLYEKKGHVLTIALNRPPNNVIDEMMAQELRLAASEASGDDEVWVVILTAVGLSFSVGSVMGQKHEGSQTSKPVELQELLSRLTVTGSILDISKPVIGAINGDAFGQGLELALACDLRLASSEARLGFPEVIQGRIPWDGGTQLLPRIVGRSRAISLLLTGTDVSAAEAETMGLISGVIPPDGLASEAFLLSQKWAQAGPIAARFTKEAVTKGLDMSLEQGLGLEADLSILLQSSYDREEGIRSFLEGRKPSFRGQ